MVPEALEGTGRYPERPLWTTRPTLPGFCEHRRMAWTYIVECSDGAFYTGSSGRDLEARIWEHNHDDVMGANFTRRRRPVHLVCAEWFETVDLAFAREKQIQGWSRAKKIALIEERGADLPRLSLRRTPDERPHPGL